MTPGADYRPSPADLAFARFCRTGDAEALAEVFDRTAPRLAVLAGHIVPGDGQAVEELVQSTFIEAMRSARRFEPGRPVMPWLITILGRQAAKLRRQKRLREEKPPVDPLDDTLDPARLAADRELVEHVAQAIDRLDSPYRQVLALRLIHGLSPGEIARALDRPLGTVHNQLHRGAERLRRRLPPIAMALVGVLTGGNALASVRTTVLEAARHTALTAPAVGAGLLGGFIMTKKLVGIAVVALSLLLLVTLDPLTGDQSPPVTGSSNGVPAEGALAGTAGSSDEPGDLEAIPRESLSQLPDRDTVTFRGRIVAADSGLPLAGAGIEAILVPGYAARGNQETRRLDLTSTDGDGLYEMQIPANAQNYVLEIFARSPGRATMIASWTEPLEPGTVVENGDVPMGLGAELTLRVVDEEGKLVSGFEIQLQPPASRLRSSDGRFRPWGWGGIQRTTKLNGTAGPRSVLAGSWAVEYAEGTGHTYEGPESIEVPADRTHVAYDLSVRSPDPARAVSGIVVDQDGTPLEGVEVAMRQQEYRMSYRSETSFGGGSFHVPGLLPERGPVEVLRVGSGAGELAFEYEVIEPREPVEVGTTGLRIVARPISKTTARFRVVDAEGAPVERFRYGWIPVRHAEGRTRLDFGNYKRGYLMLGLSREHPGGLVRLDELLPYHHVLVVVPQSPALRPVLFHEFLPDGAEAPVEITLGPSVEWKVHVTGPDGEPKAGSTVDLVRGIDRESVAAGVTVYTREDAFERGVGGTYPVVSISEGTTNADGITILRTASDVEGSGLRVRGARHLEGFVKMEGLVQDGETRNVVVQAAARILGRLEPLDLLPTTSGGVGADREPLDVTLYRVTPDGLRGRTGVEVMEDGVFAFDALAPGDYLVRARYPNVSAESELGAIRDLRAGEERSVVFDLRRIQPARLTGTVSLDGSPAAFGRLGLGGHIPLNLDARGRFDALVAPGEQACGLEAADVGGVGPRFEYPEPLLIAPGSSLHVTLEFFSRRVDFRVTDLDGAPVARKWIELFRMDEDGSPGHRVHVVILDEDGRGTLEGSWHEPLLAVLTMSPVLGPVSAAQPTRHLLGPVEVPDEEVSAGYEFSVDLDKIGR